MTRKSKTLLLSLALLALLGGGYYAAVSRQKKKADAARAEIPAAPKLGNLESSALVKLEVPGIVLEKRGGDIWELVSLDGEPAPLGIELDQSQIAGLTYSLATVWADRLVEETPADISIYGLDKPQIRASAVDAAGKRASYMLGNMTSARDGYYVMEEGNPAVYIVSSYTAENMAFPLDRIRVKSLFPPFEFPALLNLRVETPRTLFDIVPRPDTEQARTFHSFSSHLMNAPYKTPRGVNGEILNGLLTPLYNLEAVDFVDDKPASLAPYGLDAPSRIFLKTADASVELLIGSEFDGKRYAKKADAPAVFTLSGLDGLLTARPFSLITKFAFLVNIDNVDRLSVSGGETQLSAEFRGKGDEGVYSLNGKKAETASFKKFYQEVIGLVADAEYPEETPPETGAGEIRVDYSLNTPAGEEVSLALIPYNRDFYALRQNGAVEFLVARNQVRAIFDAAGAVVYEE